MTNCCSPLADAVERAAGEVLIVLDVGGAGGCSNNVPSCLSPPHNSNPSREDVDNVEKPALLVLTMARQEAAPMKHTEKGRHDHGDQCHCSACHREDTYSYLFIATS